MKIYSLNKEESPGNYRMLTDDCGRYYWYDNLHMAQHAKLYMPGNTVVIIEYNIEFTDDFWVIRTYNATA